jgi:hypothetical protein
LEVKTSSRRATIKGRFSRSLYVGRRTLYLFFPTAVDLEATSFGDFFAAEGLLEEGRGMKKVGCCLKHKKCSERCKIGLGILLLPTPKVGLLLTF